MGMPPSRMGPGPEVRDDGCRRRGRGHHVQRRGPAGEQAEQDQREPVGMPGHPGLAAHPGQVGEQRAGLSRCGRLPPWPPPAGPPPAGPPPGRGRVPPAGAGPQVSPVGCRPGRLRGPGARAASPGCPWLGHGAAAFRGDSGGSRIIRSFGHGTASLSESLAAGGARRSSLSISIDLHNKLDCAREPLWVCVMALGWPRIAGWARPSMPTEPPGPRACRRGRAARGRSRC